MTPRTARSTTRWLALFTALLITLVARRGHAQTRVTIRDSARYTFIARPIHDTVVKTVTVTKCFNAQLVPITCPTAPAPAPSPTPTPTPTPTPVPVPTPPPADTGSASGAPSPRPTDVIILSDNFDTRTSFTGYATAGTMSLITPGANGTGKAARFSYSAGSDDNLIEKEFTEAADIFFRYRYRILPAGTLPNYDVRKPTGSGMKWFMPWRASDPRYTCGIGKLTTPAWQFTCHDNASPAPGSAGGEPNPFGQNIAGTPSFASTNDGQWHEYTLHIVTGNAGYEQIWIDGVRVLDNSDKARYPYQHSAQGINRFQFPGLVVEGIPPGVTFTIDIDDFVVWRKA